MENWDSKTLDEARVSLSQLKHAIRAIHQGPSRDCKHLNSTYNGEAQWCYDCKRIWLVEDIAEEVKKLAR